MAVLQTSSEALTVRYLFGTSLIESQLVVVKSVTTFFKLELMMETAQAYDSMPYPSKFFIQTHPDQIATLANFHGLKPAPPETCRVLELGCGNGSNLLSHAFNLPNASFVGIDISPKHIESANEFVETIGLKNVRFFEADLMTMNKSDFGEFDYIVAHGLISWIPEPVFDRVFSVYNELLSPNGIGYISFNAYPGCHYRDMVRNLMRFQTRDVSDPMEKVQTAISQLAFFTEHSTEPKVYKPILEHELQRHFEHEASDIFHDDLGDFYRPLYFHEFAAKLKENGLQYLSEAELRAMSSHDLPPETNEFLDKTEDIVERQQYMDFFRGRLFRQSLICREDQLINRETDTSVMDGFKIAGAIMAQTDDRKLTEQTPVKFVGRTGLGLEIDHPVAKTCLFHIGRIWGAGIGVLELLQTARQILEENGYESDDWETDLETAKTILFRIVQGTDLVQLHTFLPDANQELSNKPKINELARWQISVANNVTTLFGLNIGIEDSVSKHLLFLLDGTRDRQQLIDELKVFIPEAEGVDNKQQLLEDLNPWVDSNLTQLAKLGLFSS